jgi:serine/threonine protein kinase
MIGLQMLMRLESIHRYGYVHRDLKPANMMVGRNSRNELAMIYLIDFGLTKKLTTQTAIPQNDGGNKVVGTAVYAPINAHIPGQNYFKKDDLESLMYVLCYLATGNLPWKNCKANDQGLDKMMKMKVKIDPFELFASLPLEFAQIMEYIKGIGSDSLVDYRYIESLFKQVALH